MAVRINRAYDKNVLNCSDPLQAHLVCIVCGSTDFRMIFTKGGQEFIKCNSCKLIRLQNLPAFEGLQTLYDNEYESEMGMGRVLAVEEEMASFTAQHRLALVQKWATGNRWLDVGCSTGIFLEQAAKAGLDAEGIDISQAAIQQARDRQLNAHAATLDSFSPDSTYDVVTGFDVIEHVLNPASFLESIHRLLRVGGTLAITTPDTNSIFCRLMGRRWYFYIPELHLFYFNRHNLASLLRRSGFDVLEIIKARKSLNYKYILVQFQAYNPLIYLFGRPLSMVTPSNWQQRPFSFYIGEMMVIAQKSER